MDVAEQEVEVTPEVAETVLQIADLVVGKLFSPTFSPHFMFNVFSTTMIEFRVWESLGNN